MKYWIVPSNSRKFDMEAALRANNGLLDWRLKNVGVGDMVFMYKTLPDGCIKYLFEVVKTNFFLCDTLNQKPFWKDLVMLNDGKGIYARLKLVEVLDEKVLTIDELRKHGIKGNIQSKRICPAETLTFIMNSNSSS